MRIERLTLGELDTNCWLVAAEEGAPLLVIDPAGDEHVLITAIGSREVAAIVLTHGHFDHLAAATAVRDAYGAPLFVHALDADSIESEEGSGGLIFGFRASTRPAERKLEDGDVIEAGGLSLRVLHTPGHTPGSICLFGDGELFSGDTLFAGSVGRTDFDGGDSRAMRASIAMLAGLPPETRVHPGHGPHTSIGREAKVNPFFPRA